MKISVLLEALTGSFETDMKRASKESERAFKKMKQDAERAGKVLGTAIVAGAAAATYAIKKAVDEMDNISKSAQKIGVTTEALSALNYAAKLADVSAEELQSGMAKLIKTQADAATGSERLRKAFEALGVEYKDGVTGALRAGDEVFNDIAQRFSEMEDGSTKTAFALELFGRSGAKLIPLLNAGRDGLREASDEARRFGIIVGSEAGKAAEEFNDNLTRIGTVAQGVAMKVATDLLPDMVALSDRLVTMANDPAFVSGLADAIRGIGNAVIFTADAISKSAGLFRFLGESLAAKISGPAVGDLVRIDEQITKVRENLQILEQNERRDPNTLLEKQLRQQLAELEAKRELTLELERNAAALRAPATVAAPTPAPTRSPIGNPFTTSSGTEKRSLSHAKSLMAESDALMKEVQQRIEERARALEGVEQIKLSLLDDEAQAVAALQAKYIDLQNAVAAGAITQEESARVAAGLSQQWADDAQARQQSEIDALSSGLLTQEEQIAQSYMRRRDQILASTAITEDARQELLMRSEQDFNEQMLEVNGSFWQRWLAAAEENLTNLDKLSEHTIEQFASGFGGLFEDLIFQTGTAEEAFRDFAEGMVRNIVNALGQMAAQWLIYKAVQAASQGTAASAAATAMSVQAQAQSAMAALNAFASTAAIPIVGPTLAPAAAAAAAAATQPMAAAIAGLAASAAASSFAGAFDAGGSIPRGSFGLVGERGPELVAGPASVTSRANTSAMLERAAKSGST